LGVLVKIDYFSTFSIRLQSIETGLKSGGCSTVIWSWEFLCCTWTASGSSKPWRRSGVLLKESR